ncbi:hypothetical protein ACHAPE_010158 [Trichoderma viride]
MISQIARRRLLAVASRRVSSRCSTNSRAVAQRRTVTTTTTTPAPKAGDGPLMSRRADRELPDVGEVSNGWRRTFPIFVLLVAASSVAIFNYQKTSSPIIASTLYALRTSPKGNALLGDEIYFKHQIPWISGQMNQVKGRIDVSFSVKGSKTSGVMRFASHRPSSKSLFKTTVWNLTLEDGTVVDLLDGADPFRGLLGGESEGDSGLLSEEDVAELQAKGFRQQGALNR